MNCNVYIGENLGRLWISKNDIYFTGCFYYQNNFLNEDEIYELLKNINSFEKLNEVLLELNGFYSFIIKQNDYVFAVVDHVRSIPIFYSVNCDKLYISNDAEYIRNVVGDVELDPISIQEFTNCMVCGSDTLFKNVKQVYTGEAVAFFGHNGSIDTHKKRFFTFTHSEKFSKADSDILEKKMINVFSECIDRLLEYAGNRQLVLPLSGGYDSRFIALMLYEKGVKNVVCFSYGVKDNFESKISEKVADSLGFRWEFVEYSNALRRYWYKSAEYKQYIRMSSGFCSLPHWQDLGAVWELKSNKIINDNAVFIPGHVGDSLAGSDVPVKAHPSNKVNINRFFDDLFIRYYLNLQRLPKDILRKDIKNKRDVFKNRVLKIIGFENVSTPQKYADIYERWNWQEFNPKFIINSVRVYEFFGYDWYLPFVDKEFMEYWKDVPLELRYKKIMYNKVLDNLYFSVTDSDLTEQKCKKKSIILTIKEKLLFSFFHRIYIYLSYIFRIDKMKDIGVTCAFGYFDEKFINCYKHYLGGVNFLSSIKFLEDLKKRFS